MLGCFANRQIPPHHVPPLPEFLSGPIIIPTEPQSLPSSRIFSQVNSFGFTGSVLSIILEAPPLPCVEDNNLVAVEQQYRLLLPFSAKSKTALCSQIRTTAQWVLNNRPRLSDVAAILSLCRDHHTQFRCALIVSCYNDFEMLVDGSTSYEEMKKLMFMSSSQILTDPRITTDVLNLPPDGGPLFPTQSSESDMFHRLLKDGLFVDAAKHLYNHGHSLAYEFAYQKTKIDPTLITSFPFYQFDRKRWWKDRPTLVPPANALTPPLLSTVPSFKPSECGISLTHDAQHTSSIDGAHDCLTGNLDQAGFEDLIQCFGAPVTTELHRKASVIVQPPRRTYLITGANGMLGCHLLAHFLRLSNFHIYCVIRGDPLLRLRLAFKRFQQDPGVIEDALADGRLHLMQTTDLCGAQLGLESEEYTALLHSVDHIIHLAWPVNFNLPLKDFLPFLACTRSLVDFCYSASNMVRLYFIGSYASTFNFAADRVPEVELVPNVSDSLSQVGLSTL
jgi:hypothetical protein